MCAPACTLAVKWQRAGELSYCFNMTSRISSAVEQRFCKPKVGGSIPSSGTNNLKHLSHLIHVYFLRNQRRGNVWGNKTRRVVSRAGSRLGPYFNSAQSPRRSRLHRTEFHFLPPTPPSEKATARQEQARQTSADDRTRNSETYIFRSHNQMHRIAVLE